jgi:hypothetical protein
MEIPGPYGRNSQDFDVVFCGEPTKNPDKIPIAIENYMK